MSGGGGGPIIINKLLEDPTLITNPIDRGFLREIADKNPTRLSRRAALKVLMVLWIYLRK